MLKQYTPLHDAASRGDVGLLTTLLLKCPNTIDIQDAHNSTPLRYAVLNGHVDVVKILLSKDAAMKIKGAYEGNMLHFAAYEGNVEICKVLLKYIEDINEKDQNGMRPLHYAAQKGHTALVRMLLNIEGIDVSPCDSQGHTPFYYAVKYRHIEIAGILLCSATAKNDGKVVEGLLQQELNRVIEDSEGETPLHIAVIEKDVNLVKQMLEKGANPEILDAAGYTPFWYAVEGGNYEVIKAFLYCNISTDERLKGSYFYISQENNLGVKAISLLVCLMQMGIYIPLESVQNQTLQKKMREVYENLKSPIKQIIKEDINEGEIPLLLKALACIFEIKKYFNDVDLSCSAKAAFDIEILKYQGQGFFSTPLAQESEGQEPKVHISAITKRSDFPTSFASSDNIFIRLIAAKNTPPEVINQIVEYLAEEHAISTHKHKITLKEVAPYYHYFKDNLGEWEAFYSALLSHDWGKPWPLPTEPYAIKPSCKMR